MSNPTLPIPIAPVLDARQSEERLRRVWRGIQARRTKRIRVSQLRLLTAVSCLSCLVCLVGFAIHFRSMWLSNPAEREAIPSSIEPKQVAHELDLGGGALVTVGPGAKVDVLERTNQSVVLALRHGLSQFDIQPGGKRRYRVESGGVSVEVVGTRFSVERSEQSLRVEVQRGRVLVRGNGVPDSVQALDAGRVLVVDLDIEKHLSSGNVAVPLLPSNTIAKVEQAPAPSSRSPSESLDWRVAATAREWERAWASLGPEGVARESARTDDVAELVSLADVARLSGHPQQALAPLRQVIEAHPDDPRAAMAAFTLGRLLLEVAADPTQAALAFERAIALKLPGALAEDAYARLVEAHAKAGAETRARVAADEYRRRYPGGRRSSDVDRWSQK